MSKYAGQYGAYTGGNGKVTTTCYTGGGGAMASNGGKLVPVTTKPHIKTTRLNGARKPNGGLGLSSSKQSR